MNTVYSHKDIFKNKIFKRGKNRITSNLKILKKLE
jgi:hypothetical protein